MKKTKNKGLKIALTIFISTVAAVVTANIITEIFKSKLKTYYVVD